MRISNDRKIKDLQREFQEAFPFLKIEFYASAHESEEGSPNQDLLNPELTLGEIRRNYTEGFITLDEEQSTEDFEQKMKSMYGLNIQVFRKSNHKWLQTWATDIWSLKEQNRRGGIMGEKGKTLEQIRLRNPNQKDL